jgi:branched-chain amino acid transport system substrate-binding protein
VRRIGLVTCNDADDPMRAARHLVDDVGVPAIVGFGSGQKLVDVAGSLLIKRGVLSVAPLTSSPLVTRVPQPPDLPRMIWRTTVSLDAVAEVAALAIRDVLAPRTKGHTRVTLARLDMAAGLSFGETFFRKLAFNGKPAKDNGADYNELPIAPSIADADLAHVADALVATRPTFLVVLTDARSVALVEAVEARWKGDAPRPLYLVANDLPGRFAKFLGASADRRRRLLTIESTAASMANARFIIRYNAVHQDQVSPTHNPGVLYDSFYLLAYAVYALGDAAPTGAGIARAFERLIPPGRPIEVGPTNVFEALTALANGERIDLAGTQTGLDLDPATGETPADFVLFCSGVDAKGAATGADVESGVVLRTNARTIDGTIKCP